MTEKTRGLLKVGLSLGTALAVVALALSWLTQAEAGPAPVAWDREACGFCRMHIGDRHFAAQLRQAEGEPVNFDDPGCLFLFLDKEDPKVVELYFRHETQDLWLDRQKVVFRVDVAQTPMGFGLAATTSEVSSQTLDLASARAWLRERQKGKQ